jgi:hypothetical protein
VVATTRPGEPDVRGDGGAAGRLRQLSTGVPDGRAVLAWFDELPAVGLADLTGRWRGSELPSGHPFDGLLPAYGWYGKEVVDPETVHPLLWCRAGGPPRPISLDLVPVPLLRDHAWLARNPLARTGFALLRPLLGTGTPRARARLVQHRGVLTAALVYDRLPVIDVFRRVTADTLLGAMDLRGVPAPYFFTLTRPPAADRAG